MLVGVLTILVRASSIAVAGSAIAALLMSARRVGQDVRIGLLRHGRMVWVLGQTLIRIMRRRILVRASTVAVACIAILCLCARGIGVNLWIGFLEQSGVIWVCWQTLVCVMGISICSAVLIMTNGS